MLKKTLALIALTTGLAVCQQTNPQVYKIGGGVTAPKVLTRTSPEYTKEARAAKIQGSVILSVVVGADGVATNIHVMQSLDPGLDTNAIAAVQQWKFQPGAKDGQAVSVAANIEVNFRLQ